MTLAAARGRLRLSLKHSFCTPFPAGRHQSRVRASPLSTAQNIQDPRLDSLGPVIEDDYATLREQYSVDQDTPQNPIVLAHGLLGFDELHIAGPKLPGVHYWRGITEALAARGVDVYTASVPTSGSIETRAAKLAEDVDKKAKGRNVNIIAGLDSRYMISRMKPTKAKVLSLTTIATPHRGSSFADFILNQIGPVQLPKIYKTLDFFGIPTGAFSQLTQTYMRETFNPSTPDVAGVQYYSYGATFDPSWYSLFRQSHARVLADEGPNDGLVSVHSARWGEYHGTLTGVSHLDLINWTNRLRWFVWELTGGKRNFNAIAFYLSIAGSIMRQDKRPFRFATVRRWRTMMKRE